MSAVWTAARYAAVGWLAAVGIALGGVSVALRRAARAGGRL